MDISTLWLFIVAAAVLIVVPGPSVFYIIARSIDQGKHAGIVSVLGVAAGAFIHVLAAAAGISALLMTSSFAFSLVKLFGAAYLIYLGCKSLFFSDGSDASSIPTLQRKKLAKIFYQSILVETLNPKVALFFLAFLPQFILPSAGSVPLQFLVLGGIFILIGMISDSMYALLSVSIRKWIVGNPIRTNIQNWLTSGTYIALGVAALFASPSHK